MIATPETASLTSYLFEKQREQPRLMNKILAEGSAPAFVARHSPGWSPA
jgi:hypothetical protein